MKTARQVRTHPTGQTIPNERKDHVQSNAHNDGREWRTISRMVNGEPMFSAFGLSILTGWDESEFTAGTISAAALREARRRASESAAWTGSRDLDDVLPFLAARMGYDLVNPSPFEFLAAKRVTA